MIVDISAMSHKLREVSDPVEIRGIAFAWIGRLAPGRVVGVMPARNRGAVRRTMLPEWPQTPPTEGQIRAMRPIVEVIRDNGGAVVCSPAGDVLDTVAGVAETLGDKDRRILSNRRNLACLGLGAADPKFAPPPKTTPLSEILKRVPQIGERRAADIAEAYPTAERLVRAVLAEDLAVKLPANALAELRLVAPDLCLIEALSRPLPLPIVEWA